MNKETSIVEDVVEVIDPNVEYKTQTLAETKYPTLFHIQKSKYYIPTHPNYSQGLDLFENEYAHLELIPADAKVALCNNVMYVDGKPLARVQYMDKITGEAVTDLDKPLVDAIFSIILMKLRDELDNVCPPGFMAGSEFWEKVPVEMRDADKSTLFEWYHRDLFNYTVIVHMLDFMSYMGIENPNEKQIDAMRKRLLALSMVLGSMELERDSYGGPEKYLLLAPGFDLGSNVVFIQSQYMNKLIEKMIRDRIPRMLPTKNGKDKPMLDARGYQIYYPEVTTIVRPEIASAKNKRAVEVVFEIAKLIARAGKDPKKPPNITYMELIGRCYDLSSVIIQSKDKDLRKRKQRNQILRRTFTNVWEYLKQYTTIPDNYTYDEYIPKDTDYYYLFVFHIKKSLPGLPSSN